jgi:uncharacterized protein YkwD
MRILFFILLFCLTGTATKAQDAAAYLAKVLKYNEKSAYEDNRYKGMDWKAFYKLEEANDLTDAAIYDFDLLNAAMFFAVNKYRVSHHLAPLEFEPRLRDAACIHSDQMVKGKFFDHYNRSDAKIGAPDRRMELCGYHGQMIAENLAKNYIDPAQPLSYIQIADKAVNDLSRSKEHNKHMLDPKLQKLGCGVLFQPTSTNGVYYFLLTQDFGRDWGQ